MRKDLFAKYLLGVCALLTAFVYSFSPIGDENDVWWHLKTGKILNASGDGLPEKDIFAYTSGDHDWHNHEWLLQKMAYGMYDFFEDRTLGGFRAVILFKALLLTACFGLLWLFCVRRGGDPAAAAVAVVLAVSCSRFSIKARPPVVTYLFMVATLWALYEMREQFDSRRRRWGLAAGLTALMIPWANMHGGFLIAILLTGFYAVGGGLDAASAWFRDRSLTWAAVRRLPGFRQAIFFSLLAGALFGASLINPYGIKLYGMYLRVMSDQELVSVIVEMAPPPLLYAQAFKWILIALVICGSLAGRRLPGAAEYLILLFFTQQAMSHVRHLPLFAIAAAPMLTWQMGRCLDDAWRASRRGRLALPAGAAVLLALWAIFGPRIGWPRADEQGFQSAWDRSMELVKGAAYDPLGYPGGAVEYLLDHEPPGRLLNPVDCAGYLIWRLSPEKYQVFTDSRFDIFGGKFQRESVTMLSGGIDSQGRSWSDLLDAYDINTVVMDKYKRLNDLLEKSGQWTMVYVDPARRDRLDRYFRVWIRDTPRPVRPLEHESGGVDD